MAADTTIDIVVNQKASFLVRFLVNDNTGQNLSLAGFTASAKFKTDYDAPDSQAVAFTAEISQDDDDLWGVDISLTPEQTAATKIMRYVYDVTITQTETGFKTRIVEGSMRVSGGVS